MTDSRDRLSSFLKQNIARSQWMMTVMTRLEPFLMLAAGHRYPVPSKDEKILTDMTINTAVVSAFGRLAARFERLPRRQAAFIEARREVLAVPASYQLGLTFAEAIPSDHRQRMDENLGAIRWYELTVALDGCLVEPLVPAVGTDILPSIRDFLFHYLGAAIVGDVDILSSYDAMMKLLPTAFPAGTMYDDSTTWVVIEP